jgi:hypothetical protein
VHFGGDFDAHYHEGGTSKEVASVVLPEEYVSNLADSGEPVPGPYGPTSCEGNRYRLARSFRMPSPTMLLAGASLPSVKRCAPADLRIDGAYCERHASPAYLLSPGLLGGDMKDLEGVISLWMKPSYYPEMSGKVRRPVVLDWRWNTRVFKFGLFFAPGHDAAPYQMSMAEGAIPFFDPNTANNGTDLGIRPVIPCSLFFGTKFSSAPPGGTYSNEAAVISPSLNHLSHDDMFVKTTLLMAHRWTHVAMAWQYPNKSALKLLINGAERTMTPRVSSANALIYQGTPSTWTLLDHSVNGAAVGRNAIRLGATSTFMNDSNALYPMNASADATIDELYVWGKGHYATTTGALTQWGDGRYYVPMNSWEGLFTSMAVGLQEGTRYSRSRRGQPNLMNSTR